MSEAKFHYLNTTIFMLPETEYSERIIKFYKEQYQKNLLKIRKWRRHSILWSKFLGLREELFEFLNFFCCCGKMFSRFRNFEKIILILLLVEFDYPLTIFSFRKHRNCTIQVFEFRLAHCFFCSSS